MWPVVNEEEIQDAPAVNPVLSISKDFHKEGFLLSPLTPSTYGILTVLRVMF